MVANLAAEEGQLHIGYYGSGPNYKTLDADEFIDIYYSQ